MTAPQIPGYPTPGYPGQQNAPLAGIPGYAGAVATPALPPPVPAAPAYAAPPLPPPVPAAAPQPPPWQGQAAPAPAAPPAYAAPLPPPAPPQGYPGPAVAAPPPPAPMPPPGYGAPPPGSGAPPQYGAPTAPPPGYGAPAPVYGQPHAPPPGDIGAAIAAATGADRAEVPREGTFDLEILETIVTVHPVERKQTFKAKFKILASNNPAHPVGSEAAYIEGLAYGAGRIQDFLIKALGYPSKAAFEAAYAAAGYRPDQTLAELARLSQAAASPETTPLKGKRIHGISITTTKTAGAKSAKAGQQVTYTNWTWAPLA
jgi:hypothetical protein